MIKEKDYIMKIETLSKNFSYKERVYQILKKAIIRNELKAGTMLNERQLAKEFGVSRTPVREALKSLEQDGWIESEAFCGTWVKKIHPKEIEDICQIRLALEPLAVELAMKPMSVFEEKNLIQMVCHPVAVGKQIDVVQFTEMDMQFHLYLCQLSGNDLLVKTLRGYIDFMSRYLIQTIRRVQPYAVPLEEHRAILMAMQHGNIEQAKSAVVLHLQHAIKTAVANIEDATMIGEGQICDEKK